MALLKHNSMALNALDMTIGAAKLKKSLKTESGKAVKAKLTALKAVMVKSDDFAKHKGILAVRRKQQGKTCVPRPCRVEGLQAIPHKDYGSQHRR